MHGAPSNTKTILTSTAIAVIAILLQLLIVPKLSFLGGNLNLLLASVVALSLATTTRPQLFFCIVCGLAFDLTQQKVFGLAVLMFVAINWLTVLAQGALSAQSKGASAVMAAIFGAAGTLIYLIVIAITSGGVGFFTLLLSGGILQILLNALFSALFYLLFSLLYKTDDANFMYTRF